MIDIIGKSLVDEAVELAAAPLRPSQEKIVEAKQVDDLAFAVGLRLVFVQARLWDLFGDAPIFEKPAAFDNEPIADDEALERLLTKMRETGHILERGMRGNLHGLTCTRCFSLHEQKDFGRLAKTCRPMAKPETLAANQTARRIALEGEKQRPHIEC